MDGAYANYVFEGTGSAQSDGSTFFERIGAVVYAYNSKEVNLWYPGSEDYLIFIGGAWGSGAPTQTSCLLRSSTLNHPCQVAHARIVTKFIVHFIIFQYNAPTDWSRPSSDK